MAFKINIGKDGKTFKVETDTEYLIGKRIGGKIKGEEIKSELKGYELEITGTSDKAGFPGMKSVEGSALRGKILKKGFAMKDKTKGLRRKKTVRGNTISEATSQINTKVAKKGNKSLKEIFSEKKEKEESKEEEKKSEDNSKKEEKPKEDKDKKETENKDKKEDKEKTKKENK